MTVRGITEVCHSLLRSATSATPSRSIVSAKALAVGAIALLTLTQVPSTEAALEVPMVFYSLSSISGGSTALAAILSPAGLLLITSGIAYALIMRATSREGLPPLVPPRENCPITAPPYTRERFGPDVLIVPSSF